MQPQGRTVHFKLRDKKEMTMKKYEAILFDLDGTLLPMDNDLFIKTYLGLLAKKWRLSATRRIC